ncbi:MAG TPA: hypothetical protein VEZ46_02230 [Mycobacteriales bacterium]|jgi:hypothetical protein|nr:hypothetical protein [Mycobacteriales bacterium]
MPCYRCDKVQTDPVKGASPWRRGVIRDALVLVCPDCQRTAEWTVDLDRCAACASTALVRELGDTRCRDCGHVGPGSPAGTAGSPAARAGAPPSLADQVTAALERLRSDPSAGL